MLGAHSDTPALAAERTTPCLRTCDAAHAQCSEPTGETGRTAAWPSLCGGGRDYGARSTARPRSAQGAWGRAQRLRACDSGLRPSSTATGHPRRARGSAGAPRERSRRWPRPNDCTRAPRPQNARRAQRCGCGQRTADSGQRTGQGKQRPLPRWRVCNAASRTRSARCRVTPCGFATVPGRSQPSGTDSRGQPCVTLGLGLPAPGRPTRTPGHPARSREHPKPLDPAPGQVTARPGHTRRQPAHAARRPARGGGRPHPTDHPTSLAPTSCGDARPSAPCAAPRG